MRTKREPWVWIFSATAFVMLCAMGIFIWSVFQSSREGGRITAARSPRQGNEQFARVYPPAYRALSSSARPAELRNAIARYSQRDYAGAIAGFAAVLATHPDLAEARFYLGVCYLAIGNQRAGTDQLRSTIGAGNTPYLEQARFYLAKGLLGSGDVTGARQELNEAIALHGDLEQQAEALLAEIK